MHFIAVCIGITDIWNNVPFFTAQHLYYAVFIFNYTSCKTWTFHISRKKVAIHYTNRGIIPAFICNFKFTIYIIAFPLSLSWLEWEWKASTAKKPIMAWYVVDYSANYACVCKILTMDFVVPTMWMTINIKLDTERKSDKQQQQPYARLIYLSCEMRSHSIQHNEKRNKQKK